MIDSDKVLEFWFGDSIHSTDKFTRRLETWFMAADEFDEEIQNRFEPCIERAVQRSKECSSSDPREILALIILLDQFPRNVYRGTPKAFAYDSYALGLTKKLIETGLDESFTYVERLFVYMPLQHSEEVEVQQLSVETFQKLIAAADNKVHRQSAEDSLKYSELHKEIIDQFGRFPHRNEILGRISTQAELDYLAAGAENFGQVKKKPSED